MNRILHISLFYALFRFELAFGVNMKVLDNFVSFHYFDWWIIIWTYILMNMMLHDVVCNWWIIIWMYILMNMMLHDVVHNWWIMKLWCEVVVVVVAAVVANVFKVVSCCRCHWSCWSLLHLLLSPRIIIHIKLGAWCPVECLIIHTTLRAYAL